MLHALLLMVDVLAVVPNPAAEQPPGFGGILTVMGWIKFGCYLACLAGLLVAAGLWALDRAGRGGGNHVTGIVIAVVAAIVVGAAPSLINAVAT